MQDFIDKIVKTLNTNGFPDKKVSLPTEKMYEAADNRGLSFNKVMDQMKNDLQIESEIGPEKIIFTKVEPVQDFSQMGSDDMMKKAQEMMASMDPAELKKAQEALMNMSDDEREELMKKGREMGLI
ncbi:MAG: hypothetical protein KC478_16835 [Bacteriovoracaceae bacterium]|nr:hypothetical protein [Bacteriovoracaceae bacterium]